MKQPLISVVMPTYNHEKSIANAIESVINQKGNIQIELIIGEDCSTDNTRNICKVYQQKYPKNIKLILNNKNIGLLPNYRNIFNICSGKYIAILESDDIWTDPYKLEKEVQFLEENPNYGLIHTNYELYDEINNKKAIGNINTLPSGDIFIPLLKDRNHIAALTVCFRKDLFDKYINIDSYIKEQFATIDYPLWLELSKYSHVKYLPDITSRYTISPNSISNNKDVIKRKLFIDNIEKIQMYIIKKYQLNSDITNYIQVKHNKIMIELGYKYGWEVSEYINRLPVGNLSELIIKKVYGFPTILKISQFFHKLKSKFIGFKN